VSGLLPPLADLSRLLASLVGIVGAMVGLLWGCGLLVARPLLPRRYHPLLPFIAPFLGFSLISAVAHYAGVTGASLRSVLWLFIGLAAAGWVLLLFDRRLRRLPRSSAPALLICLLAFLLAVGPLLVLGYLTTIGGTIDGINYAVRSEYLQDAPLSLPEIEAGKPYLAWVRATINLFRAGDVYLVGLLGLLTGKRSYELLSVVPALFFALTSGSVYVLTRAALGFCRRAALLAAALVGIHNLLLWPVYDNFLSQAIALSFLPLVLGFGIEAQRRPDWRMAALFAILFSALVSVYPIFAVSTLAAVLLFWGLAWLLRPCGPRGRYLGQVALWWLVAAALAALWNGFAFVRSAEELGLVSHALRPGAAKVIGPGNILVFPPVVEIFGLIAHAGAAYLGGGWQPVPMPLLNAFGLFLVALAAYGWWRLNPRARLAVAALLLTGAVAIAQQRWGSEYPYGYFKTITTVVAEVMMLVAAGIVALWRVPVRGMKWLAAGVVLLLLGLNLKHTLWTQSYALKSALVVDHDLIDIARSAGGVDADGWILLDIKPQGIRETWLGYLIRERKIRFREPIAMGHVDTPGAANAYFRYAVVDKELDELRRGTVFDEPWYDPAGYTRLAGNNRFELRERRDPVLASVRWDRRWPMQAELVLALAPSQDKLSTQLGAEVKDGGLAAERPRTVQVRVYSLDGASRLTIDGLGPSIALDPGSWHLDIDLDCVADGRIVIAHAAGEAILSDVRVLRTDTGRPEACLERVPLPTGIAYLEQDDMGNGRIRLRATLLRPESAGERLYRLGLHVIEVNQGKLFGTWSLDFPAEPRVQRGSLELDLRNRSSRSEIDGRPVNLAVTSFDHDEGLFEADAVWWQFNPLEQLQIEPILWFERSGNGAVRTTRALPEARLEVLAVP